MSAHITRILVEAALNIAAVSGAGLVDRAVLSRGRILSALRINAFEGLPGYVTHRTVACAMSNDRPRRFENTRKGLAVLQDRDDIGAGSGRHDAEGLRRGDRLRYARGVSTSARRQLFGA